MNTLPFGIESLPLGTASGLTQDRGLPPGPSCCWSMDVEECRERAPAGRELVVACGRPDEGASEGHVDGGAKAATRPPCRDAVRVGTQTPAAVGRDAELIMEMLGRWGCRVAGEHPRARRRSMPRSKM
jgi:hypothetical protein